MYENANTSAPQKVFGWLKPPPSSKLTFWQRVFCVISESYALGIRYRDELEALRAQGHIEQCAKIQYMKFKLGEYAWYHLLSESIEAVTCTCYLTTMTTEEYKKKRLERAKSAIRHLTEA